MKYSQENDTMKNITLDYKSALGFFSEEEIFNVKEQVRAAHNALHNKTGAGSDFLGWVTLPKDYDKEEFARIKAAAEKIRNDSDVLIVIGIGGSYLGAKAAIDFLSGPFYNYTSKTQIFFAGNSISPNYINGLLKSIEGKDVSVNIISKSGTTTEPAIAFRIFKEYLENKYGKEEARKRIYATTDKAKGALKNLADSEGYETFVVPDDVGGRFSVLTAVGLLPIAVCGADIDKLMQGAADASELYASDDVEETIATSMRQSETFFIEKARMWKCLLTMSRSSSILLNGGNSSMARVRARTRKVSSLQGHASLRTCIQWVSIFRMD